MTTFGDQLQGVAVVIEKSGRFLVGKRAEHKKAAGYWCAISGKIELGETEEEAVARESFEEVGLRVEPYVKLGDMDTHDKRFRLHWWLARILDGEAFLKNDEHRELKWVTADEFRRLDPIFEDDVEMFEEAERLLGDAE